jgi:hypothetical protein
LRVAVGLDQQHGQVTRVVAVDRICKVEMSPAEKNGTTFPVAGSTALGSHLPVACTWKPWN